jgi:hypothetical protein
LQDSLNSASLNDHGTQSSCKKLLESYERMSKRILTLVSCYSGIAWRGRFRLRCPSAVKGVRSDEKNSSGNSDESEYIILDILLLIHAIRSAPIERPCEFEQSSEIHPSVNVSSGWNETESKHAIGRAIPLSQVAAAYYRRETKASRHRRGAV